LRVLAAGGALSLAWPPVELNLRVEQRRGTQPRNDRSEAAAEDSASEFSGRRHITRCALSRAGRHASPHSDRSMTGDDGWARWQYPASSRYG